MVGPDGTAGADGDAPVSLVRGVSSFHPAVPSGLTVPLHQTRTCTTPRADTAAAGTPTFRASLSPRSRIPIWPPTDAAALTPLQQLSAYLTLAVTPIITEEFAPILGGVAASQRQLGLARVILAVTIGGWIATALLYLLGAWRGPWVRRRFPRAEPALGKLLRAVGKRPWRASFAVRIAFGARLLLPLACGMAHVRPTTYFVGSLAGSAAWSTVFVLIGYEFGDAAVRVLERAHSYERYAYVLAAVAAIAAAAVFLRRRRARRAAAETVSE